MALMEEEGGRELAFSTSLGPRRDPNSLLGPSTLSRSAPEHSLLWNLLGPLGEGWQREPVQGGSLRGFCPRFQPPPCLPPAGVAQASPREPVWAGGDLPAGPFHLSRGSEALWVSRAYSCAG